jgi:transposase-like protein
VAKKGKRRYSEEFRRMAVARLEGSDNISALSQELGVDRGQLYRWQKRWALDRAEGPPGNSPEALLRKENSQLKRLLAEQTLELSFFKGALQKVEARRQPSGITGAKGSTTKSRK